MSSLRARVVRGLVSGLLHEAVSVVLSFAAMMVLVRLLTPADYGEAAAAVGVLTLVGACRASHFVDHALQHARGAEPDWNTYFALAGTIQIGLCVATLLIAAACRNSAAFAPIAPLLAVGALGFLVDWPAQVGVVKLRRELRIDRLKILSSVSVALRLTSSIALAWWGCGALALVLSGNLVAAVPHAFNFLVVEGWRPRRWLLIPAGEAVRPIVRFGGHQIAAGLVHAVKTAAESVVLTKTFGVAALGLVNRALALYQSTVGRLGGVFVETTYPLLPVERNHIERYAYRATRFLDGALLLSIPGAAFLAFEGAAVSRLLYGQRWVDADPYLVPGTVALCGTAVVSAASYARLGTGRVRSALATQTGMSLATLVLLLLPWHGWNVLTYLWALAALHVVSAVVALALAAPFLEREWMKPGLWPVIAATAMGVLALGIARQALVMNDVTQLLVSAVTYGLVVTGVLAVTARGVVMEMMHARVLFGARRFAAGQEARA